MTPENQEITKKEKKWLLPVIIVAALVLIAVIICAVLAMNGKFGGGKNKPQFDDKFVEEPSYDTTTLAYSELLEIAAKALEEGDYDTAIENYEKVLEMDDTVVEAYLGLIEAYIRKGDFEKALEIAKKGYQKTGDPRIKEKMDMLEGGNIADSRGLVYKQTTYDANHQIMYSLTYEYDADSVRTAVTSYDANGVETGHVDLVSDSPNIKIDYGITSGVGTVLKHVLEIDGSGRTIKRTDYDENGVIINYSLYEYDGGKTIQTQYDGMDDEIECQYISYDEGNAHIWEGYKYDYQTASLKMYRRAVSEGGRTDYYDGEGNLDYYSVHEENGWVDYNPDGSVKQYSVEE